MISYFEPIIKNCIDNNIDETQCYCSKKNYGEYLIPTGYYTEFKHTYDRMKQTKN